MAQKRMFDKGLLETDAFMDMPMATKALYFLLGMEADDEGFVSPNRVMRIYGGNVDDLKVLIAKNFVIQFDTGVVVITDWKENNYLDKNRIKETKYKNEKKLLSLTSNKYSLFNGCLTDVDPEESRVEENRIEEKRISKGSDKPSKKEKTFNVLGADIIKEFEKVDAKNKTYYANKTQRGACDFLLEEYGVEQVKKVILLLPQTNTKSYFPSITSPNDLKEKWEKLKSALVKYKEKEITSKSNIAFT